MSVDEIVDEIVTHHHASAADVSKKIGVSTDTLTEMFRQPVPEWTVGFVQQQLGRWR